MIEELSRLVGETLKAMRARRFNLSIATISGGDARVVRRFEEFAAAASAGKSRFVAVVDEAGFNLFRRCLNYPRKTVWFIVALGHHDDFPNVSSYICPNGSVMFVEGLPLTKEQEQKLASGIRTAGNRVTC